MTRVSEAVGVASAIEQNSAEPAQRRRGASKAPRARPFLYLYTTALWFRRAGRREGTRCMTCPGVRRTAVFACGRSGASRSGSGFKVAEDLIPVHPSARGRREPDAENRSLHNEGTLIFISVDWLGALRGMSSWTGFEYSIDFVAPKEQLRLYCSQVENLCERSAGFSAERFVVQARFPVERRPAARGQQMGKLLIMD